MVLPYQYILFTALQNWIVNPPQTCAEDGYLQSTDASIYLIFFNGPCGGTLLSSLSDVDSEAAVKHESYYP